jgi:hypothetical protein
MLFELRNDQASTGGVAAGAWLMRVVAWHRPQRLRTAAGGLLKFGCSLPVLWPQWKWRNTGCTK